MTTMNGFDAIPQSFNCLQFIISEDEIHIARSDVGGFERETSEES